MALVEDHLDHAAAVAAEGIDVVLFGLYPWNQAEKLPERVTRVPDWPTATELLIARATK